MSFPQYFERAVGSLRHSRKEIQGWWGRLLSATFQSRRGSASAAHFLTGLPPWIKTFFYSLVYLYRPWLTFLTLAMRNGDGLQVFEAPRVTGQRPASPSVIAASGICITVARAGSPDPSAIWTSMIRIMSLEGSIHPSVPKAPPCPKVPIP
jgi:hypothetical protein